MYYYSSLQEREVADEIPIAMILGLQGRSCFKNSNVKNV